MGTEGDSFFVVFPSAPSGAAALEAPAGPAADTGPPATGPGADGPAHRRPGPHEDGYIGMDVHRAARVAAIAHGGQVVLTDATAALVRGSLPTGPGCPTWASTG